MKNSFLKHEYNASSHDNASNLDLKREFKEKTLSDEALIDKFGRVYETQHDTDVITISKRVPPVTEGGLIIDIKDSNSALAKQYGGEMSVVGELVISAKGDNAHLIGKRVVVAGQPTRSLPLDGYFPNMSSYTAHIRGVNAILGKIKDFSKIIKNWEDNGEERIKL